MQTFKIEHFERDHPGRSFPEFVTLARDEAVRLRAALASRAGLEENTTPQLLLRHLLERARAVESVDAQSAEFSLVSTLHGSGLKPEERVYINWNDFRTIDRMALADLSEYFHEIWYPSADDIEIFDDTLSWVLFVRHFGALALVRLHGPI